MTLSGTTQVYGLVGHPVRHSLSPYLHGMLFERHDIDAVYVAFDVAPAEATAVPSAIRTLGLQGVNLTVPFKVAVFDHLDHVSQAGLEAGAVNVIVNKKGQLTGHNTDGEGFVRGLEERFGTELVPGGTAVVLGAGGAGRAVCAGLASRGVGLVRLANRTLSRAEDAVATLSAFFPFTRFEAVGFDDASLLDADLVVNCTGGGAAASVEAFDVEKLEGTAVWCDINYWMRDPPRVAACEKRGLRVQDGLPMLVHQAAISFELFTGVSVDASEIFTLLQRARAAL